MLNPARQRARMVRNQIARRGVSNPDVLAAMRRVPRERFVPAHLAAFSYDDGPLPIEAGQTISQPYIVALMIEAAKVAFGDRVLEIGTGSGYAAAIISRIVDHVYTIERHAVLADMARRRLTDLRYENVDVRTGDGTHGWPEAAPFDAILVAAGGPEVPDTLRRQLKVGGRLVMPVGEHDDQRLVKLVRTGEDAFQQEDLGGVMFVPLIGAHG
ncbi:protein-L-isoaspartate(D-aspartate) O-methyltransferase [Rhodopila sp.]|uniref:protein-L-isoaspartate(D-aspartate) O-methyltransferase n=1 Tax=Rhodopila sp. TaxID=2480087 RepID=UPI003D0A6419